MDDSAEQPRDDGDLQTESSPQVSAEEGTSKPTTRYDVSAVRAAAAAPPVTPERAAAAAEPEKARGKRVAVFVAHGMGQQIPFQTLDQVAEGLLLCQYGEDKSRPKSRVRAVKTDDQWLHRIELDLKSGTADAVEAHVYEGYWAPLTEGKISLRQVVGFMRDLGRNGIKVGNSGFCRWLFNVYREFDTPIRTVFYLMIALATVLSLMVMNWAIAAVSAGRALLAKAPSWLSNGLFADLTTTFNVVVTTMAVFGFGLGLATLLRKKKAPASVCRAWSLVTVLLFIAALFVIILGALSLALLFYGHVKWGKTGSEQLWSQIFPAAAVDRFNASFATWTLRLVIVAGALFLGWWIFNIVRGVVRDLSGREGRLPNLIVTICMVILVVLAVRLGFSFWEVFRGWMGDGTMRVVRGSLVWLLLIAASAFVRQMLIQFVGDVAIYAAPYKLDSFFQLRGQIKQCVEKVAGAVYALKRQDGSGHEYDQVFIVGHSLGSVVVYDVLNRLVNEDEATGRPLNVVARTPLLLTFGSPLDKTAFLLAIQKQHTDEAREALAAAVQPLIQDYGFRPERWINIWSPWDIFSGPLDFYDLPESKDSKRVCNLMDPEATTLLAAHVEYWENTLLFKTLYDAL